MTPVYDISPLLNKVNRFILNPLIALLFAVALVVFLWGIVKLIRGADDPKVREEGKKNIMYGILGMFIMIAVYGIIAFIISNLGVATPTYIAPKL